MKRFVMSLAMGVMVLTCGTARATVIDDFSTDSSAAYNVVASWLNPGASAASYALNANGQFAPTPNGAGGATTLFLRNDGYTLNVGDTVSLEVNGASVVYQTSGLVLCPSLTDPSGELEYYAQNRSDIGAGVYGLDGPVLNNYVYDLSFASGPVTVTLTRTSDTTADYVYTYHTTTGGIATLSGTDDRLTAGTCYFGMACYDSAQAGPVMDNLSYTAVPEPSMLLLVGTGIVGLLAYAWRKRR